MIKYILLIYSQHESKPYLLTWIVCNCKTSLNYEYKQMILQDMHHAFNHYTYKWIALQLTTKK